MTITDDYRRMAALLNLSDDEQSWPMEIIRRLISIETRDGSAGLAREVRMLVAFPRAA